MSEGFCKRTQELKQQKKRSKQKTKAKDFQARLASQGIKTEMNYIPEFDEWHPVMNTESSRQQLTENF